MRLSAVMVALAAALAVTVVGAAAQSPESYLHTANAPPKCASPGEAPDAAVTVCQGFAFGGVRIALPSQSIILGVGDAESSQADCRAGFAATTHDLKVDGVPAPITVSPCRYIAPADLLVNPFFRGNWAVFYRTLFDAGALAPGAHAITFTTHWIEDFSYSLGCTDPSGRCTVPAGSVEVDAGQLIIE
jgi:hypothetical protein